MKIPSWALRPVTTEDHSLAKDAHQQGRLHLNWPNINTLRRWAKQHGWPTPFFGFEEAFMAKMLATKENFEQALEKSGLEMQVPKQNYTISAERIRELDLLYAERSATGHPNSWGSLLTFTLLG